jgi:hypothetical protein
MKKAATLVVIMQRLKANANNAKKNNKKVNSRTVPGTRHLDDTDSFHLHRRRKYV